MENIVNNVNTFYTGGFVRDLILYKPAYLRKISQSIYHLSFDDISNTSLPIYDIDISTSLDPKSVAKLIDLHFPNCNRVRQFATNKFDYNGKRYEITSTRIDYDCDGRNAKMKFGASFYRDSFRRDFTFNALYMRKDGIIFDFHNGIEHLQRGEIRFIGDAVTRVREDYTRIKRYYDFSKRLGIRNYEIEQTIDYIMKNSTEPIIMR